MLRGKLVPWISSLSANDRCVQCDQLSRTCVWRAVNPQPLSTGCLIDAEPDEVVHEVTQVHEVLESDLNVHVVDGDEAV